MQFGVHVFPTQFSIQPDELARAAEERGIGNPFGSQNIPISPSAFSIRQNAQPIFQSIIGKRTISLSP